jgi:hypothetical protein
MMVPVRSSFLYYLYYWRYSRSTTAPNGFLIIMTENIHSTDSIEPNNYCSHKSCEDVITTSEIT